MKQFDVKLKFKKSYLQDEVREVQTTKIKGDVCEQLTNLGLVNKKWCWDYLNIPDRFRPTEEEIQKAKEKSGLLNQGLLTNNQVLSESPEKQVEDADKQTAALRQKP